MLLNLPTTRLQTTQSLPSYVARRQQTTNPHTSEFMTPWLKKVTYSIRCGRNAKYPYYIKCALRELIPSAYTQARLPHIMRAGLAKYDFAELADRVDYYNKLATSCTLSADAPTLASHHLGKREHVYYFDTREFTRFFQQQFRWHHIPGDVTFVPEEPTIVKSRPIAGDNANSVLLKLNKIRHFVFVNDHVPFAQKKSLAVFRGKTRLKPKRIAFFNRHFGNPLCDLGDTSTKSGDPDEWKTGKMTIREQLAFKFILAIEGNDVASNLKWILSSNSVAIMPRPEFETWFMEGRLVPNVHYIEIAPDYADLDEKIRYYSEHPEGAEKIIQNAQAHVAQFGDPLRERLLSLLVMKKYFDLTN